MFLKGATVSVILCLALCSCRSWGQFWLTNLTYPASPLLLTQNVAMAAAIPRLPGSPSSCTAAPSLPAGLTLDQSTCAISGTPTQGQGRSTYRITADVGEETVTGEIMIRVLFQPKFVYTANSTGDNISRFQVLANGQLSAQGVVIAEDQPWYGLPSHDHKFLYTAHKTGARITVHAIDPASGALNQISGSPYTTLAAPHSLSLNPAGTILYVGHDNAGVNGVSAFSVNTTTGALTALNGGSAYVIAAGFQAASVAVDPGGKHLYVGASLGASNAYAMAIDSITGALTPLAGSPFGTISNAISVAVHPNGNFVYFAQYNDGANGLVAFRRDSSTGALQHIPGPFATQTSPTYVTLSVDGQLAYVTNSGAASFSGYKIDVDSGKPTATPNSPYGVLTSPQGAAIDETVNYIYVPSSGANGMSVFNINQTTGEVSVIGNSVASPYATGAGPVHVVVVGSNP